MLRGVIISERVRRNRVGFYTSFQRTQARINIRRGHGQQHDGTVIDRVLITSSETLRF